MNLLLGVSGGIAAYKSLELVRLATAAGHAVRVIQTPASQKFVGAASFSTLSGAPVLTDEFEFDPTGGAFPGQDHPGHAPISHLELVANADVLLIAPASANTIAKLAAGFADNLLTTSALAARCPLLVAPAMNNNMYEHPATQANIAQLRDRGVVVVDPQVGSLASKGEWGVGRLPDPAALLSACEAAASPSGSLAGKQVLITAGGTREPVDQVRFIGNRSSGRMGYALAAEAARRGAKVKVVAANVELATPAGVEKLTVTTAAELQAACEAEFPSCDILLMAAAVADYRPERAVTGKIKKDGADHLQLDLKRTEDVLSGLAASRSSGQLLVGFAAESGDSAVEYGRAKLQEKQLDLIVVNDISRSEIGFESSDNEVTLIGSDLEEQVSRRAKAAVAKAILDRVEQLGK